MLFLQELVKFKTAFGKLWLAGVKPNSVKKKPFSKDLIKNADILALVDAIFNTDVPLSPRLSGTFLCGVCAIYDQKCHYFELDVISLFRRIHFTKRLKSVEDDEPQSRKRRKRSKTVDRTEVPVEDEPDLNAMLNDMELDLTQMNLNNLQKKEEEETNDLEALVRSQLYQTYDNDDPPREKRLRGENRSGGYSKSNPNNIREINTTEIVPRVDEDDDLMMNEDELFNELHETCINREQTNGGQDNRFECQSPVEEITPPPLSFHENDNHSGESSVELVADPDGLETPTRQKTKLGRRRKVQHYCEVVVDKDTFLPEEMLREWRIDRSSITNKRMTRKQLCDSEMILTHTMLIGYKRFRRMVKYSAPRESEHRAPRIRKISAEPRIDDDTSSLRFGNKFDPGYEQIERLRGLDYEENQIFENGENFDFIDGRRKSLPSGGDLSPLSLDEVSGTRTERSSLADPFREREDLRVSFGGVSSIYDYDNNVDLESRRESLSSNRTHEMITAEWFDPNELIAAVSPSGCSTDPNTLVTQLDIESNSMNTNSYQARSSQAQKCYTIESWRFRSFIEKCLDKEKSCLMNDASSSASLNEKIAVPFSAIVTPGTVSSLIAARSFYQLLVLASTGDIVVYQKQMSGEILISQGESMSNPCSSTPSNAENSISKSSAESKESKSS